VCLGSRVRRHTWGLFFVFFVFRVRRGARYRPRCLHDRCGSRFFCSGKVWRVATIPSRSSSVYSIWYINHIWYIMYYILWLWLCSDEVPPFLLAPVLYVQYGMLIIWYIMYDILWLRLCFDEVPPFLLAPILYIILWYIMYYMYYKLWLCFNLARQSLGLAFRV